LGDVTGVAMNPQAQKLVITLGHDPVEHTTMPLQAIYALRPPTTQVRSKKIAIRSLPPCDAVLKLIGNTYNRVITEPIRLARQFRQATQLATRIPIKSLRYPRDLSQLPLVVEAIRLDLSRSRQSPLSHGLAVVPN
jgi:hypothetical protein